MKVGSRKASGLASCMLMLVSVAVSAPKDKGKDLQSVNKATGLSAHVGVDIFIGRDRDVIRQHYMAHPGHLPPGLAKRGGDLPPGLAKQLRRKGHLPPGLEKKVAPFPIELERRLPPLKPGLIRGVIGGRAVIFDAKTSVILDVFMVL